VLSREAKSIGANPFLLEYRTFVVVSSERSIYLNKGDLVQDIAADQVTKLQKGAESAKHLGRYVALDDWEVDLIDYEYIGFGIKRIKSPS
jgi:hypothetical protein